MLPWQLPRQFVIVLRFGWKERPLVEQLSCCLIGQGSVHTCFRLGAFGGQASPCSVIKFRKLSQNRSSLPSKSCVCGKT
ncbi:hypothetical protein FCV50_04190 [Vibrio kanaloae]|uniref:Uncharacterized protein n=1 Tax=Vibrio kanaloae TaxID=170673 RepID=A0A4V5R5X6_9VIBR|nr:hypothetical protein FCV50_04190 [Vibrio kanaloae]